MSGPNIMDVTTLGVQQYDAEIPNFSVSDWTPTRAPQARALLCTTAGTAVVTPFGLPGGSAPVAVAIPLLAGQQLNLIISRIAHTGSSGAYVAFY